MITTDQDKPLGKPGQRNRKAERRSQKSEPRRNPTPDQPQDAKQQIEAAVMSTDAPPIDAVALADPSPIGAGALADASPIGTGTVAAAEPVPISLQTIANAYGDYTRKSLEETRSLVEQLTGVRSLDKAIEIQAEFAKHACETFLADSQKIWELYSELAKQIFKPLQGFLAKATQTAR
jgi:hypothetical protein